VLFPDRPAAQHNQVVWCFANRALVKLTGGHLFFGFTNLILYGEHIGPKGLMDEKVTLICSARQYETVSMCSQSA
jgi:hypothetical protein